MPVDNRARTSAQRPPEKGASSKKPRAARRRLLWWIGAMVVLGLALTFSGYAYVYRSLILPKVMVGSVDLGGLTADQANQKLVKAIEAEKGWQVSVDGGSPLAVPLTVPAVSYDVQGMVSAATEYGRGSNWQWFVRRLKALVVEQHLPVLATVDAAALRDTLDQNLYSKTDTKAQEVHLVIKAGKVTVADGASGMLVDRDTTEQAASTVIYSLRTTTLAVVKKEFKPEFTVSDAAFAKTEAERAIAAPLKLTWDGGSLDIDQTHLAAWLLTKGAGAGDARYAPAVAAGATQAERILLLDVDTDKVAAWLGTVLAQIEQPAQNAAVQFTNGSLQVVGAAKPGFTLKVAETAAAIRAGILARALGQKTDSVTTVVASTDPIVTDKNLATLGIKELIGTAASDYSTSPDNRKHNIALGVSKVNGQIVLPGQEFSLIKTLGNIDGSQGYLPEKVIIGNHLELQFGGGLCQPATTLFRALLDAVMPLTERTNHSLRVSSYEQASSLKGVRVNWDANYADIGSGLVGYDATIYSPEPDLKFRNDSSTAVLIQGIVTNNRSVTFQIYGTNDGRQVAISKAIVLGTYQAGAPLTTDDPSLPTGTDKTTAPAVPGAKTSFTYTVTYADGHQSKQTFTSYYAPVPAQVQHGTGAAPAPAATDPAAVPAQ